MDLGNISFQQPCSPATNTVHNANQTLATDYALDLLGAWREVARLATLQTIQAIVGNAYSLRTNLRRHV